MLIRILEIILGRGLDVLWETPSVIVLPALGLTLLLFDKVHGPVWLKGLRSTFLESDLGNLSS